MHYLVSIENTSFFYWQIELLIESFVRHGIQDNLVIAIAENYEQKVKGYSRNLIKYCRKFMHGNVGGEEGHLPLNRVVAIRSALAEGVIQFPFALIHADMILKKPFGDEDLNPDYSIIVNNYDEMLPGVRKEIRDAIEPKRKKVAEDRNKDLSELPEIPPFSAPIIFNKLFEPVSEVFFSRLHTNTIDLIREKGGQFPCERAAWELTLAEAFQHCSIQSKFMAGPLVSDKEDMNFIHYKNGVPPTFHKRFFKFDDKSVRSGVCPYDAILEHNPTVNTGYAQEIVKSYKGRA